MLVTGVQAVGSKGVTAIQGTVVDTTRGLPHSPDDDTTEARRSAGHPRKPGEPQPVVFARNGADSRPVALRQERAAARYRSDGGGEPEHDDAA